jgi:S1-C subfamily serine protease
MKFAILVSSLLCLGISSGNAYAAKPKETPKLADLIDIVRPSVVKVEVIIRDFGRRLPPQVPPGIRNCFGETERCIVGTGFFVNSNGDVITACHVVDGYTDAPGVKQIIEILNAVGIRSEMVIGVAIPNIDTERIVIASGTMVYPASTVATDPAHDVALIRPINNPFTRTVKLFGGNAAQGFPEGKPTFVTFSVARPRDGEDIFACGYPFGQSGLITTSGTLASAWNTMPLLRAESAGVKFPVEVYWVDLRVSPGDSGGPVFKVSDQSVIGIAVEEATGHGVGIVIPAKFVTAFLKSQGVTFASANTAPDNQPKSKRKDQR